LLTETVNGARVRGGVGDGGEGWRGKEGERGEEAAAGDNAKGGG